MIAVRFDYTTRDTQHGIACAADAQLPLRDDVTDVQAVPLAANIALEGTRWQYVFAHWQPSGTDELSAAIPAFAAIIATWFGAFP